MSYGENVRNDLLAIGTSNVLVSPARKRSEIVITNTSTAAQNITISFGIPAVSTYGVYLLPYAVYFASNAQGFNVWEGEIYAISDGAAGQISIFER